MRTEDLARELDRLAEMVEPYTLRSAAARLRELSDGWQTIDSAPREPMDRFTVLGPPIILGFAPDEEGYTKASREGYWRPALPPGENGRAYSAGWVSTLDPHVEPPYENPTHFRPLPQPPGDAG